MTLLELFQTVKEKNLSKEQLEGYRDELSSMYADIQLEVADIEKEEAIFFYGKKSPDVSDISIKREWRVTHSGQRLILLSRYLKATEKILASLKSRLYSIY